MMKQCIHETRLQYLLRVAISHIREHAADKETEYDESSCDGSCLADDLQIELDGLPTSTDETIKYRPLTEGEEVMIGDEREVRPGCWIAADPYEPPTGEGVRRKVTAYEAGREKYRRPLPVSTPKQLSAPCPRCTHFLTERPLERVAAPSFVEITCPRCLLQSAGETRNEALGFMATNAKISPNGYKKPAPPDPGPGWHLIEVADPLQPGDGFIKPGEEHLGWIDYKCRPQIFRDEEGGSATAYTWAWRRRDAEPQSPPCLCETSFTPECPVHSVSIHTAADAPLSCGPNCKHTPEEHQAFDIGVDMAERDPNAENPCRKFTNPREDLIEAWEAGASVGRKNREDVEGGPAYS